MDKYIIYDDVASWEKQFIFQDLLNINHSSYNKIIYNSEELNYSNISNWEKLDNLTDIINNNIFIFSSNSNQYSDILKIVKLLKPVIIIHLSDEWRNKEEFQGLHQFTKLVLRQYYHVNYYQKANIQYIPLGYMNGMLESDYMNKKLKKPSDRQYKWSFIGNKVKKDRPIMINSMSEIVPNFKENIKTNKEITEIYRNSIFVPTCTGHVGLNTLRITEAIVCGAIPIIVGSEEEIKNTFYYEKNPPWLVFSSWEEAKLGCLELLKNMEYLDSLSNVCICWWKNRILNLREQIVSYL